MWKMLEDILLGGKKTRHRKGGKSLGAGLVGGRRKYGKKTRHRKGGSWWIRRD